MTEQEHKELVAELRVAIERTPPGERRERLLARLHQLEQSHGTESFGDHVKALIEEAEVDAAGLAPFMSRLSSLLP
ncbi:MAG TPA: hypothetical protein VKY24_18760 [Reyranella sp.]|jgi:hypothetical protein|nr:hypothetical protein [Reyranella sp.]